MAEMPFDTLQLISMLDNNTYMRTGGLQRTIAIITLSEVMSSGDVTEDASKIEVIRGHVIQKGRVPGILTMMNWLIGLSIK